MNLRAWAVVVGLAMWVTPGAYAQQTVITVADDQLAPSAASARRSAAPQPERDQSFVDRTREWARDTQIIERVSGTVDGWYPRLGGIRRGSGFGGGPGYRLHVGDILVDVSGGISVRNYQTVGTQVRWLHSRDDRAELWTDYEYDHFTQELFFGIGSSTPEDARTDYALQKHDVSLRGVFKPRPHVALAARVGYMHPRLGSGTDPEYASTEQRFTDADAAGLATQPSFVHASVMTTIDTRNESGRPSEGGLYHVEIGRWSDRVSGQYDFSRVDATAAQYFRLTEGRRHVLVTQVGLAAATADTGARVPFYMLPYIGGADTIRGFIEYRFKGEDALWYGAEYRWTMMPYVSLAGFADAGKAAHTIGTLGGAATRTGYGAGIIAHTDKQTLGRLDVAYGSEGWQWWFDFGIF